MTQKDDVKDVAGVRGRVENSVVEGRDGGEYGNGVQVEGVRTDVLMMSAKFVDITNERVDYSRVNTRYMQRET